MSEIDTMTIKDARDAVERGKQIASLLSDEGAERSPTAKGGGVESYGLQIVILDRGFVYVGNVTTDGQWCVVTDAKNVRRWGTTKGLGELAKSGPTKDTVLDPAGTVRAPLRALIGLIACESASWAK